MFKLKNLFFKKIIYLLISFKLSLKRLFDIVYTFDIVMSDRFSIIYHLLIWQIYYFIILILNMTSFSTQFLILTISVYLTSLISYILMFYFRGKLIYKIKEILILFKSSLLTLPNTKSHNVKLDNISARLPKRFRIKSSRIVYL